MLFCIPKDESCINETTNKRMLENIEHMKQWGVYME